MSLSTPGGCLCGRVRFTVQTAPLRVMQCHCRDCQRQSGSAFSVNLVVKRDDIALEGDEPACYEHLTGSGNTIRRRFCGHCGSPLFSEFPHLPFVALKLAAMDDPTPYRPSASLWCERQLPWVEVPDGIPRFARNPG